MLSINTGKQKRLDKDYLTIADNFELFVGKNVFLYFIKTVYFRAKRSQIKDNISRKTREQNWSSILLLTA